MSAEFSEIVAAMIVERQAERSTQWRLRREAKAAARAERQRAREVGLIRRHAAKLARGSTG